MNHDGAHCIDYDKKKCPSNCFRAKLVKDLKDRPDLIGIPISWASFIWDPECWRSPNYKKGNK